MVVNWKTGGVLLELAFLMAVVLVKPIVVSAQFVMLDGIVVGPVFVAIAFALPAHLLGSRRG